jgi:hypothetical protein
MFASRARLLWRPDSRPIFTQSDRPALPFVRDLIAASPSAEHWVNAHDQGDTRYALMATSERKNASVVTDANGYSSANLLLP